ncbi:hypothetical protein C8J57DRAFT_1531891 [Mycena rebaudengoi]|nr:hypothetical protein C8J57DRAFT_1531891 [Mycena rebaudengoi]
MAEKIPDEIVSEILALHLKVPDDLFSQASSISLFVSLSQSSSDVLLVCRACRAWLRCGTPFLYRTHKDLGRFIKMLRVEGGFGSPMQHILKFAPNISDICLSLPIRSFNNISDFVKNKVLTQLVATIIESVKKWSNLKRIDFPYYSLDDSARGALVRALFWVPSHLHEIATISGITEIELRTGQLLKVGPDVIANLLVDLRLKSLLTWSENLEFQFFSGYVPSVPPTNPRFLPMASATQSIVDRIWSRILFFAMIEDRIRARPPYLQHPTAYTPEPNSPHYLLVCSTFKVSLSNNLRAAIDHKVQQQQIALPFLLSHDASLGTHVREIFARVGALSRVITWDAFQTLAETAGGSLVELTGIRITEGASSKRVSPSFSLSPTDIPTTAFPALEILEFGSAQMFAVMSEILLPSLRRVILGYGADGHRPFLLKHGAKLEELTAVCGTRREYSVFELCPTLLTLTVGFGDPVSTQVCLGIRRIIL